MVIKITICKGNSGKTGQTKFVVVVLCVSDGDCDSTKKYYYAIIPFVFSSDIELNCRAVTIEDNGKAFGLVRRLKNDSLVFAPSPLDSLGKDNATNNQRPTNSDEILEEEIKLITDPAVKKQELGTLENGDIKYAFKRLNKYMNCADTPEILTEIQHYTVKFWSNLVENERFKKLLNSEFGNAMDKIEEKKEQLLKRKNNQAIIKDHKSIVLGQKGLSYETSQKYEKDNKRKPNANDS